MLLGRAGILPHAVNGGAHLYLNSAYKVQNNSTSNSESIALVLLAEAA